MSLRAIDLERALERERNARLICSELDSLVDLRSTLMTILTQIKEVTDCHAVAIRLHHDGDYPYYVCDGFRESFIEQENSLCALDENGERVPSPDGQGWLLECACGDVIRGRCDPSLRFFTEYGSFWTNASSALLASSSKREHQSLTRKTCNLCGYESVALIPLKTRGERIGILQLNDRRIGMFTQETLDYLELIAAQMGLGVQNSLVHARLREALEEIDALSTYLCRLEEHASR